MKNLIRLFAVLGALLLPRASAYAEDKAHDCLVVVFDGSGSMSDPLEKGGPSKMELAKPALKKVLAREPKDEWIGIVVFSKNVPEEWIVPLGPRDPGMNAKIEAVVEGGSTPLGTYIKKGADALLKERDAQFGNGRYRLIVVTDGAADKGREEDMMRSYAPEVVERDVRLDVIGLGMDDTHALAQLADSYQPASSADDLSRALAKVVNVESSGSAQADAEDLAMIGPLPDDLVKGWIDAVTQPKGNWPIGESAPRPKLPDSPVDPPGTAHAPPANATVPAKQSPGCSVLGFGSLSASAILLAMSMTRRRSRRT